MKNISDIMQIEIFKTNIEDTQTADKIICAIQKEFHTSNVNCDLSDCDKVLRVEAEQVEIEQIIKIVRDFGFSCQVLN